MSKQRYMFLDVETTGLNPFENEVIEVGVIVMEEDKNLDPVELARFHGKFGAENGVVDIEALKVNRRKLVGDVMPGTDDKDLRRDMVASFADFLVEYHTKDTFVIGVNIKFDIDFLVTLLQRYGIRFRETNLYKNSIDIQHIARFMHDKGVFELENFRGKTIHNAVMDSIMIDNYHSAMLDAIWARDLYFQMREI